MAVLAKLRGLGLIGEHVVLVAEEKICGNAVQLVSCHIRVSLDTYSLVNAKNASERLSGVFSAA